MIGSGAFLEVSDNSGAREVQCIQPSGKFYTIGDIITVAVKRAVKGKVAAGSVQKVNYMPCVSVFPSEQY